MLEITIFEEAMCCSTGVCGPDPDDELVAFTHAVDTLEDTFSDVEVTRANMSSDIERFLDHEDVADAVESDGPSVLPITTVDGDVVALDELDKGASKRSLARSLGIARSTVRKIADNRDRYTQAV